VTRSDADAFVAFITRLSQAAERLALGKATAEVARRYTPELLSNRFEVALSEAVSARVGVAA